MLDGRRGLTFDVCSAMGLLVLQAGTGKDDDQKVESGDFSEETACRFELILGSEN
jgi:hypothetical protein